MTAPGPTAGQPEPLKGEVWCTGILKVLNHEINKNKTARSLKIIFLGTSTILTAYLLSLDFCSEHLHCSVKNCRFKVT